MRRPLIAALVIIAVASMPVGVVAEISRPRTEAREGDGNSSVVITNPGASSPAAPEARRVGSRRRSSGPVPEHVITRYEFRGPLNGDSCIYRSTTRRDTPMSVAERSDNEGMLNYAAESGIPACADEEQAAPPTPAEVAEAFLREIPLPAPEPRIAPDGQAITGLAAYLETNGALTHRLGPSSTDLGPIVVDASSVYWVDWGDGSPEAGPFAFEGEAHPTGRIFHSYRYRGDYTVTVRQAWTAQWRLGAESGTVGGLVTQASIPVDVDEVQAVIRR